MGIDIRSPTIQYNQFSTFFMAINHIPTIKIAVVKVSIYGMLVDQYRASSALKNLSRNNMMNNEKTKKADGYQVILSGIKRNRSFFFIINFPCPHNPSINTHDKIKSVNAHISIKLSVQADIYINQHTHYSQLDKPGYLLFLHTIRSTIQKLQQLLQATKYQLNFAETFPGNC